MKIIETIIVDLLHSPLIWVVLGVVAIDLGRGVAKRIRRAR